MVTSDASKRFSTYLVAKKSSPRNVEHDRPVFDSSKVWESTGYQIIENTWAPIAAERKFAKLSSIPFVVLKETRAATPRHASSRR
ncbi:hypothetical protein [Rhizobium miluonense]|uniref:Uncharacterized protein n=1 Tax=Rhizobium miluonense TaxID=411945 RepID=A0A1C3UDF2_9HYPH|nr:hypothetical protein [Rhizobium miluonense]SCB13445.1 hypothetical protein GA0061102_100326 [Rhizobium miluonense]